MVLWPFKKDSIQRIISIILIIIGVILILTTPIIKLSQNIELSGFALGTILGFLGLLYFFDIQ